MKKVVVTHYLSGQQIVITQLSGTLNYDDIDYWKFTLDQTISSIPDNSNFKILVNLHGFQAENVDVHNTFRKIIPLLLANYGYRIGYLEMFPETTIKIERKRGVSCIAMAKVHQDETKMQDYEAKFSSKTERYFTDPVEAYDWIRSIKRY